MYAALPPEVPQPGTCAKLRRSLLWHSCCSGPLGSAVHSRASASPRAKPAHVVFTMPSWT
eukprot:13802018-Alexandrium_andersonii.AAC.1